MEILSENRKAGFEYEILEKLDAGIELKGYEVKSVKIGRFAITGALCAPHVTRSTGSGQAELFLMNSDIPPYQPLNTPAGYDSKRPRRLLVTKKEVNHLIGSFNKGMKIIPLKVFVKNNLIKVEIALVRNKRKGDKREYLQKKDSRKEIKRILA